MEIWEYLIESEILSINFDPKNKMLRLELSLPWSNETGRILADGVVDFVANEMRLSNIIDRATALTPSKNEDGPMIVAPRLFFLMRGRNPEPHELNWPTLKERLRLINDKELTFLEIEPIYGASILILASQIQLELPADTKRQHNQSRS